MACQFLAAPAELALHKCASIHTASQCLAHVIFWCGFVRCVRVSITLRVWRFLCELIFNFGARVPRICLIRPVSAVLLSRIQLFCCFVIVPFGHELLDPVVSGTSSIVSVECYLAP